MKVGNVGAVFANNCHTPACQWLLQLFPPSANPRAHSLVFKFTRRAFPKEFVPSISVRLSSTLLPTYRIMLADQRARTVPVVCSRLRCAGGLSAPGCWAHPDMLSVGVTAPQPPGALHHCAAVGVPCQMNLTEMRTNFGAWCIVSAPLILAMDLRDTAELDYVWSVARACCYSTVLLFLLSSFICRVLAV